MKDSNVPATPIGMFDSGPGGLAVLREVRRILPGEDVVYIADTARQPYGTRPTDEVRDISVELAQVLVSSGAKIIVIACNTASIAAAREFEDGYQGLPVVGMIAPAVDRALASGQSHRIVVWGTELTVASNVYADRMRELDREVSIVGIAPSELLRLAERGEIEDKPYLASLAARYFEPVLDFRADTLLLGCTDLTCVRDVIDDVVDGRVEVLDPAEAVADTVAEILAQRGIPRQPRNEEEEGTVRFLVTGNDVDAFSRFARAFLDADQVIVDHFKVKRPPAKA